MYNIKDKRLNDYYKILFWYYTVTKFPCFIFLCGVSLGSVAGSLSCMTLSPCLHRSGMPDHSNFASILTSNLYYSKDVKNTCNNINNHILVMHENKRII